MTRQELIQEILDLLREETYPVRISDISKILRIKSDSNEYFILKDTIDDLIEKQLIEKLPRRRIALKKFQDESTIKGIFKLYHGKAIVETENPNFAKINIKERFYNTALDGDTVTVQLHAVKKGKKPKGEVLQVINRSKTEIVGTLDNNGYFYFLVPDDPNYYVDFLIPDKKLNKAKVGDKVKAKFLKWSDPTISPTAEISEVIGKAGIPVVEYDSIIKEFEIVEEFPDDVIREAKKYKAPGKRKPAGRLDLRDELIITIDPVDAKDFDDALSLKMLENGNYWLGVHIADVSHYVEENSGLDIEARFRGNSIYLVDRVVPMLPEELSNEICSLKPNEPRMAFSCFMEITPKGAVKNYEVHESIIISKRRYNYDEVLEIIETGIGDNADFILELYKLSDILRKKRYREGSINFDTREYKFVLDENKYPVEVKVRQTTKSTALVEECMLIANRTVANYFTKLASKYLKAGNLPTLYRVHEEPDPKKLTDAIEFFRTMTEFSLKKQPSSKDINKLLQSFENLPEKPIVHQVLIRSMAKAAYSPTNFGHYGLGFNEYVHFTSPIRRYPDLIVHRLLKEYMKALPDTSRLNYLKVFCRDAGKHCSETERTAMDAERASVKLTHSVMASGLVGEIFEGTISGVTSFGLFVQLDGNYAEGLLHIRDLNDDYYVFDEAKFRLVGRKHKKIFGFGTRLKVKIIKVNLDKRTIDLAYIEQNEH
ncbi:MAG: ribonuclease R [Candidatus Kapabacteria bacterium]|nr:ribonuclease R [Ignavibacteriota bacterium]MCW5883504.1 ribonuclease R [Candidatus Kapabacteria bacterium]